MFTSRNVAPVGRRGLPWVGAAYLADPVIADNFSGIRRRRSPSLAFALETVVVSYRMRLHCHQSTRSIFFLCLAMALVGMVKGIGLY